MNPPPRRFPRLRLAWCLAVLVSMIAIAGSAAAAGGGASIKVSFPRKVKAGQKYIIRIFGYSGRYTALWDAGFAADPSTPLHCPSGGPSGSVETSLRPNHPFNLRVKWVSSFPGRNVFCAYLSSNNPDSKDFLLRSVFFTVSK